MKIWDQWQEQVQKSKAEAEIKIAEIVRELYEDLGVLPDRAVFKKHHVKRFGEDIDPDEYEISATIEGSIEL